MKLLFDLTKPKRTKPAPNEARPKRCVETDNDPRLKEAS